MTTDELSVEPETNEPSRPGAILTAVAEMISTVIGDDEMLGLEITLETSFADDLELESIEFVSLAEEIKAFYGEQVDFVEFLASKELDEIMTLTVGDLVEHVAANVPGAADG